MIENGHAGEMSRAQQREKQGERLSQVLKRVYEKTRFYQEKFDSSQVRPEDIQSVEDLYKLPFTTKEEVKAVFPYGLLTMPVSGVSHVTVNQGIALCYTQRDMETWQRLASRLLAAGEVNGASVFQLAIDQEKFRQHIALYNGAMQLGATLVPAATEDETQQIQWLRDFGVTALYGEPNYLLDLAHHLKTLGLSPYQLPLKVIFCSAQWLDEFLRSQLQLEYGVKVQAVYGMETLFGMPIAGECHLPNGLHLQEDAFCGEIIDPVTGEVLPEGMAGELVLTSLLLEAMPVVRYRTGLTAVLDDTPCSCGQPFVRIKKV